VAIKAVARIPGEVPIPLQRWKNSEKVQPMSRRMPNHEPRKDCALA